MLNVIDCECFSCWYHIGVINWKVFNRWFSLPYSHDAESNYIYFEFYGTIFQFTISRYEFRPYRNIFVCLMFVYMKWCFSSHTMWIL